MRCGSRLTGQAAGRSLLARRHPRSGVGPRTLLRRRLRGVHAVNRMPATGYEEGTAYPLAPAVADVDASSSGASTGWRSQSLEHLTSRSFGFRTAEATSSRLRLDLRLPPRSRGSEARLLVYRRSGAVSVRSLPAGPGGKTTVLVSSARCGEIRADPGERKHADRRLRPLLDPVLLQRQAARRRAAVRLPRDGGLEPGGTSRCGLRPQP